MITYEPASEDHTYCVPAAQSKLSNIATDDIVSLPRSSGTAVDMQCPSSVMVDVSVQCSLAERPFSISVVCDDKNAIHFYTGLSDYQTFLVCFEFLGDSVNNLSYWYGSKNRPQTNRGASRALTPLNEFFLVMCRLRLGLLEQDLAYRFLVSQSTVSRICITWINFLFVKFKEVPLWPTRACKQSNA